MALDYLSPDDIVQCFVIVSGGSKNEPDKFYGPFVNFDAALNWIRIQPYNVGFAIGCMRTPNKTRTSDDFHLPVRLEKDEGDFFVEL